jgi:type I restriction enzyme S subunit
MIADLKPYADYKESGLPWIGAMPAHWDARRLRHACEMRVSNVDKHTKKGESPVRLCNYVDVYKNERIKESLYFMSASATKDELMRFRLRKMDVVITKDSEDWKDIGVPSLVEYEAPDLVCGYHLAILRPRLALNGAFLHRVLQCHFIAAQLRIEANGVTRYGLSHGAILGVSIPLPSPEEQAAIVRFLDWANRRLDRAIRAKRKVIALLNEQKQAIIHRAVTRGLDPSVPLKASGISWLGDIPKHWEARRSKYVYREVDNRSESGEETHLSMSQKFGLVPYSQIEEKRLVSESYAGAKLCEKGDLVLNRLKAHLGVFALAPERGLVSPDYTVLRPLQEIEARYFEAVYRSPACRVELRKRTKGIVQGFWRLYTDDFYDIRVPFPPVDEQKQIIAQLDIDLSGINTAISRLEREIDLLREYRTRLVADMVTGKLDVREAAAKLPVEEQAFDPGELVDDDSEMIEDEITEQVG